MKSRTQISGNVLRTVILIFIVELLIVFAIVKTCSGQVPNTTTFSLQDVENNISGTQGSLNQCFIDAIPSYFNATHKNNYYTQYGNLNNLLMFRDYGPHNASAIPTVITNAATSVSETTATLNGEVTGDGGSTITERGFRVSSSSDMSGSYNVVVSGTTGIFNGPYEGTCTNYTRYFQAYATNSVGTGYGSILNFTTTSPTLLTYTFYTQVDGVTINSSATAAQGANAAYWNQIGTNTNNVRYAATMTGTGQRVFTTNTHPACEWISSTPGSTFWYVVVSGASVWTVELDYDSKVITSTAYSPTTTAYTTSSTWTTPANIRYAQIECWGGGGTGGPADGTEARAAGGAGGSYAKKLIAVPNSSYVYTVGGASTASTTTNVDGNPTFFGNASFASALVGANGGLGGAVNTTTGGASATTASSSSGGGGASIGDVIYAGGNGGAGTSASFAGGGGGGAGSTGAGNNASNQTAGTAKTENGGEGGAGTNTTNTRNNGNTYGGGGSGGITTASTNRQGGNGAAGYLRITY